jgi:hypothetical protein
MDEMFYAMHVSNSNYYMHISCRIRGTRKKLWFLYEDWSYGICSGYYSHEEEIIGLHVSMGNAET